MKSTKRLTTEEFIKRAINIHGDRYGYSKVVYINARTKVCIICNKCHKEFWQLPSSHLSGKGCKCNHQLLKEDILNRFHEVHHEDYDYSDSDIEGVTKKIKIKCNRCGNVFYQTPDSHIRGCGCPKCSKTNIVKYDPKTLQKEFETKAQQVHGLKYSYGQYIKSSEKIEIKCNECGHAFYQTPSNHLSGKGCPNCKRKKLSVIKSLTLTDFINKSNSVHNNYYDYSESEYINNYTLIKVICPIHGEFWQLPHNHMNGKGCPKCNFKKLESDVLKFLENNNIKYESQKSFEWLKYKSKMFLDFYLPEYNIAIECQGGQHFKSVEWFGGEKDFQKRQFRDNLKFELCKEHKIKILYYSNIEKYDNFLNNKVYHSIDEIINQLSIDNFS